MVAGASAQSIMAKQFEDSIGYLRASMHRIEECMQQHDLDQASAHVISSQKQSLSMWESVAPILESLLAGRPIGTGRSLAESKCAANLRTLGADKAEFKNWNERFINTLAQSLG